MAFSYTTTLQDPTGALSSATAAAVMANLKGAMEIYARAFTGLGSIDVVVIIDLTGRELGSGRSTVSVAKGVVNGVNVADQGAVNELRTGADTNDVGFDIEITLPPTYLANVLWLDPDPLTRAATVAAGKFDAVSFFLHELGHAFGFNGWGDLNGVVTGAYKSVYDTFVVQKDGVPYFTGPEAKAVYGGDVPLSGVLNNYHHYSHGPTDGLDRGLMQGSTYSPAGFRWYLDSIDLAMFRDLGITTVAHPIADVGGSSFYGFAVADLMQGGVGPDGLYGRGGDDTLTGGGGDDILDGGDGVDTAVYAAASTSYSWSKAADGSWAVKDLRAGAAEGADTLKGVEILKFSDKSVALQLALPAAVDTAWSNILRGSAASSGAALATDLVAKLAAGTLTPAAAIGEIVKAADATTSVATLSYQFFTGKIPGGPGMDFLVSPTGPNANNLNSAYYQSFSMENRYINFAVNLGKVGEGAARFTAEYGALGLFDATRKAYAAIFGSTPTDAKIHALIDTRTDYFDYYGKDGPNGQGTKAAMVGWLLAEAEKADLGIYAKSNAAFLTDLADGASFAVDLIGVYGKPEFNFLG